MRHHLAVVALAAFVTGACSSSTGASRPTLVEAWRTSSITPIGQAVAAGVTLVVYGTVDKDLFVYGVSVKDGTIRWRQPASPSDTLSGSFLTPTVLDGRVVYFRPDPKANLAARLVVASPDTGSDLLVSEPLVFGSHPAHCSEGHLRDRRRLRRQ